jgi:sporulation protein YlmC with PRC-barrel domain
MLRSARELRRFWTVTTDGARYGIHDFLFDERHWAIRYLVISTGTWLRRRRVLIPSAAVAFIDPKGYQACLRLDQGRLQHARLGNIRFVPGDLRRVKTVARYHVRATDGEIGRVKDFIVDDDTFLITHLVVETRTWPGGHSVLVAPAKVRRVERSLSRLQVSLTRQQVHSSPAYRRADLLARGSRRASACRL